jgi:hypothetical protein
LAAARTDAQRATAAAEYKRDLEAAIGTWNLQSLAALQNRLSQASRHVIEAVNLVLPVERRG